MSERSGSGRHPVEVATEPPEGTHPDAGAAASKLPVPEGATREMVALGPAHLPRPSGRSGRARAAMVRAVRHPFGARSTGQEMAVERW